ADGLHSTRGSGVIKSSVTFASPDSFSVRRQVMATDAVVIGGGLGGLTAANFLARRGGKVTLLERAPHVGGRATSQEFGGALFNQGPHALYRGGHAMRVLNELGIRYTGRVPGLTGNFGERDGRVGPFSSMLFGSLSFAERFELMRVLARITVT